MLAPENGIMRWVRCDIERFIFLLGTPGRNVDQRNLSGHPDLWFFVGLDCLRWELLRFVNRRSLVGFQSPTPSPSVI